MPKTPESLAQLGLVHEEAKRGEGWAVKTVKEWSGKKFGHLPERVGKKKPLKGIGKKAAG